MTKKVWAPKLLGEIAEAMFVARALALGYRVLRPHGDSDPYDFVIAGASGVFKRIQVKGSFSLGKQGYALSVHGFSRPYSPDDVDFCAGLIFPENLWYIIPSRDVCPRTIVYLIPPRIAKGRRSTWERYREAWWRLGKAAPPPLRHVVNVLADAPCAACEIG